MLCWRLWCRSQWHRKIDDLTGRTRPVHERVERIEMESSMNGFVAVEKSYSSANEISSIT